MRLHTFFIHELIADAKELVIADQDLFHQLRNVFRLNVGSEVILLDNSGFEYVSRIASYAKGDLSFVILLKRKNTNIPKREVKLFQSIVKKDNFEWVLQKGTELGVSHFVPVLSERSEKKNINLDRGRKILKEASEQSGRGILPELAEPIAFESALDSASDAPCVAFDSSGKSFSTFDFTIHAVNCFIGPEGGWSEKELALFKEKNIPLYSLGTQTLRAETAAIAISALLLLDH